MTSRYGPNTAVVAGGSRGKDDSKQNTYLVVVARQHRYSLSSVQIQKEFISNLKLENHFLSEEIGMGVYILISTKREVSKPVLKLDFTAHGIMDSPSEFGLC